jgi:hypothetical protein
MKRNEEGLAVEESVDGAGPAALPFTGNSREARTQSKLAYLNAKTSP